MSISKNITISKCSLEMETEICTHGCTVEWKIHNFDWLSSIESKEFHPPGCGFIWKLFIIQEGRLMSAGVRLSDIKQIDRIPFSIAVHLTLQNTLGKVYVRKEFSKPSLFKIKIERPSSLRPKPIPGSDGQQFTLGADSVLVLRAVILSKGCCYESKEVKAVELDVQKKGKVTSNTEEKPTKVTIKDDVEKVTVRVGIKVESKDRNIDAEEGKSKHNKGTSEYEENKEVATKDPKKEVGSGDGEVMVRDREAEASKEKEGASREGGKKLVSKDNKETETISKYADEKQKRTSKGDKNMNFMLKDNEEKQTVQSENMEMLLKEDSDKNMRSKVEREMQSRNNSKEVSKGEEMASKNEGTKRTLKDDSEKDKTLKDERKVTLKDKEVEVTSSDDESDVSLCIPRYSVMEGAFEDNKEKDKTSEDKEMEVTSKGEKEIVSKDEEVAGASTIKGKEVAPKDQGEKEKKSKFRKIIRRLSKTFR